MSRSTLSGPSTSMYVTPAVSAARRWAARLPGPNATSIASGGRSARTLVPVPCRSVTRTTIGASVSRGSRTWSIARRCQQRQVDRQDHQGVGAAGDDIGPCVAETGVEAARALAEGPCPEVGGAGEDVAIGAHDQHVREPIDGQGGHHGPCQEALDEVLPLLGVELLAEARLGALERADRDDRRDPRHRANPRTSRATRARPARSAMIVSVTSVRRPSAAIAGSRAASTLVEDEGVDVARVLLGHSPGARIRTRARSASGRPGPSARRRRRCR